MDKKRIVEDYRRHQLVAMKQGNHVETAIYSPKEEQTRHVLNVDSVESAILELKRRVDADYSEKADAAGESPDVQRVVEGLRAIMNSLTDGHLSMLKAHYHAEERTLTTTELAMAAGYPNFNSVNLQYGLIGQKLYEYAPIKLPTYEGGGPIYTFFIATGPEVSQPGEYWKWTMRPEVAKAMEQLGLDQ